MRRAVVALVSLLFSSCAGVEAPGDGPGRLTGPGCPTSWPPPGWPCPTGAPRYDRAASQPRGRADEDRDGCNTREEVLLVLRSSALDCLRKVQLTSLSNVCVGCC